jgi:acetolactate synthase-1/2/3 large subunit
MTDDSDQMTGAELLRRALVDQGTDVIFGHPGGAILPFYDALHGAPAPRHVLVRHEQSAAHAADGWARATGGVGVCCATSGPGATNLVTGLATAHMDGVAVVAITGQVPLALLGTEAFQATDIVGITMPVTKHGYLVTDVAEIPDVVAQAFALARQGRPGPVVVDVPKCVQVASVDRVRAESLLAGAAGGSPRGPGSSRVGGRTTTAGAAVAAALTALRGSERPVVLAGRGVVTSGTTELLARLVEECGLPVTTTLLGLDAYPAERPLALGMPGMHGTERANRCLQQADLILGLGARFDDRVIGRADRFAPRARIVHFDIDPRAHGRTLEPEVAVLGDLRETLPPLVRGATETYRTPACWLRTLRGWRREAGHVAPPRHAAPSASSEPRGSDTRPAPRAPSSPPGPRMPPAPLMPRGSYAAPPAGPILGRQAARALAHRIRRDGAIVVTDVGQHQMWLAQELGNAAPGTHLTSGGFGTMGYALPAALGAALAQPERPVWAVVGDGGFQMSLQELATVVQEGVRLRIAVVNNGHLGMVRQWQEKVHGNRRAASTLSGPDFAALATLYGLVAESVDDLATLEAAVDRAALAPGPVLLDVRIAPEDSVYPMVRPGGALDEVWDEPAPLPAAEPTANAAGGATADAATGRPAEPAADCTGRPTIEPTAAPTHAPTRGAAP